MPLGGKEKDAGERVGEGRITLKGIKGKRKWGGRVKRACGKEEGRKEGSNASMRVQPCFVQDIARIQYSGPVLISGH